MLVYDHGTSQKYASSGGELRFDHVNTSSATIRAHELTLYSKADGVLVYRFVARSLKPGPTWRQSRKDVVQKFWDGEYRGDHWRFDTGHDAQDFRAPGYIEVRLHPPAR